MSDCFAPTPKNPIDVHDQVVGTHAWAERLRWHRYHEMKSKAYLEDNEDSEKEEDEAFEKKPWYKPTDRSAPRDDPALEPFIEASSAEFLDQFKRRKIKDNLTSEQRKALNELKKNYLLRKELHVGTLIKKVSPL